MTLFRRNHARSPAAAIAVILLMLLAPPQSQAQSAPAAKLVIGIDEDANTFVGMWGRLLYAEISRRLGLPIELITLPQQRRSEMADAGAIDGETSRIHAYGAAHPNLVRVEEDFADIGFALYTANPDLRIRRLADLSTGQLFGEYRRGVLFCEKALKSVLPEARVSDVTDAAQGARKLIARRTDVYCDLDDTMLTALNDPDIKGASAVRKLFDLGKIPTYSYLHKKHADLAPRLAIVIKQMKADGLIEAYRQQTFRAMGWAR